jgi:hypothetical protein
MHLVQSTWTKGCVELDILLQYVVSDSKTLTRAGQAALQTRQSPPSSYMEFHAREQY